jgi:hypothetical protein
MKKNMNVFILTFPMIFQSLMGPRKSRCDVPYGTTQRWACPNVLFFGYKKLFPFRSLFCIYLLYNNINHGR